MVFIDDENVQETPFSIASLRQFYVPSTAETNARHEMQTDKAIEIDEETECASVREDASYCGRIHDAKRCALNTNCKWDSEFGKCEHTTSLLVIALCIGAIVPIVYGLCYFLVNHTQIDLTWSGLDDMHNVYLCSAFLATCAFLYILSDILYSRAYNDTRHQFAYPLMVFFIGALFVPISRAMWILRDYSQNFVSIGLLLTSGGLVWLMKKYMEKLRVQRNRLGAGALYYVLFHVLLFDNFLWWWMVFSSSSSSSK